MVIRIWGRIRARFNQLSLAQRFMLASLVILVAGMYSIGLWVETEIEAGVVHRTAATTALYVDSFIAPNLQELTHTATLTPAHVKSLNWLLGQTDFGRRIAAFKVWTLKGQIVFSPDAALMGKVFPVQGGLAQAVQGEVAARISDLSDEENVQERAKDRQLLEMYSPVRSNGTGDVIAVAEFYYTVDELQGEITAAQWRTLLVVGAATAVMYLLLSIFVRGASNTIVRQRAALSEQVTRLTALLAQNEELSERVRRAAGRTTALNERFLRRVSAELHDGPAQDLGLALLRLDHVIGHVAPPGGDGGQRNGLAVAGDLDVIESSLRRAMEEVRAISSGLGVPAMSTWTLPEIVSRVVSAHERRTGTKVDVTLDCPAEQAALPVKITLYRLLQEALGNAFRHAGGRGQQVLIRCSDTMLQVAVSDRGPGFEEGALGRHADHLGLSGMRERVESLGGFFQVESTPGDGTTVRAELSLHAKGEDD